jgi:hypothetical protein
VLPAYKQGELLPSLRLSIAWPQQSGVLLSHVVREARTAKVVGEWPQQSGGPEQFAFHQVGMK